MKTLITNVQVFPGEPEKNILGYTNISLNYEFIVKNIRIVQGEKGVFLGMPSHRNKYDEYSEVFFPVSNLAREELTKIVIDVFRAKYPDLIKGCVMYGENTNVKSRFFRFRKGF